MSVNDLAPPVETRRSEGDKATFGAERFASVATGSEIARRQGLTSHQLSCRRQSSPPADSVPATPSAAMFLKVSVELPKPVVAASAAPDVGTVHSRAPTVITQPV